MNETTKIQEAKQLLDDLNGIAKDSIELFEAVPLIPEPIPADKLNLIEKDQGETFILKWHTNDIQMVKSKELAIRYDTWYQKTSALVERYVPYQSKSFNEVARIMESYVTLNRFAVATQSMLDSANKEHQKGYVSVYLNEFASVIKSQTNIVQSVISIPERRPLPQPRCFLTGAQCTVKLWFNPSLIFVIIPFSANFNDVYQIGIKEVVHGMNWECVRADEIVHTSNIMCVGVCQPLRSARYIVAELTNRNPNVLYELGLCHAYEKEVIMITQDIEAIPFDLRGQNIIVYKDISELRLKLTKTLEQLVA